MVHSVMHEVIGLGVAGADGPIGQVKDVYFDDHTWTVRYLLVDTAEMMPGHKALLSPASIEPGSFDKRGLRAACTREQIEQGPGVEANKPISRQLEQAHADHYGYRGYWDQQPQAARSGPAVESNVRSAAEVVGCRIRASDGEIGHVEDFLLQDDWSISTMVVDTRNWLPGKKVQVAPSAIEQIDWKDRHVDVKMQREELKRAPQAD